MKKIRKNPAELPVAPLVTHKKVTAPKGENFFDTVFMIARKIPKGRVTSYGAIAECSGSRLSARMVGWAMNAAGGAKPPVPAHRVVNRNGMLTGKHHFPTPTLMEERLRAEGVEVKDDKVVRFKELFWDPSAPEKSKGKIQKSKGKE
jgi:methylated-DNA-protein-cysteine methyltransferase related protein